MTLFRQHTIRPVHVVPSAFVIITVSGVNTRIVAYSIERRRSPGFVPIISIRVVVFVVIVVSGRRGQFRPHRLGFVGASRGVTEYVHLQARFSLLVLG